MFFSRTSGLIVVFTFLVNSIFCIDTDCISDDFMTEKGSTTGKITIQNLIMWSFCSSFESSRMWMTYKKILPANNYCSKFSIENKTKPFYLINRLETKFHSNLSFFFIEKVNLKCYEMKTKKTVHVQKLDLGISRQLIDTKDQMNLEVPQFVFAYLKWIDASNEMILILFFKFNLFSRRGQRHC